MIEVRGEFSKKEVSLWLMLFNYKWAFIIFVVVLMILKDTLSTTDPIDSGVKTYQTIGFATVVDRNGNGFEVRLTSRDKITDERLEDFMFSSETNHFYNRLDTDAIRDSISLIDMDIYDFLDWMVSKKVPNYMAIDRICGIGFDKRLLYLQPNPFEPTYITDWKALNSAQGMVYINNDDVRNYLYNGSRTYRYLECKATVSFSDEQYTHISPQIATFINR